MVKETGIETEFKKINDGHNTKNSKGYFEKVCVVYIVDINKSVDIENFIDGNILSYVFMADKFVHLYKYNKKKIQHISLNLFNMFSFISLFHAITSNLCTHFIICFMYKSWLLLL